MTPLNVKFRKILWINVVLIGVGVGVLVYMKFHNVLYALGGGLGISAVEYAFLRMSLGRKQAKEQEGKK